MTVLINGEVSDGRLAVTDSAVMRGDGCFEAIRVYEGAPFEVDRHLARLGRNAELLQIPIPPVSRLRDWVIDLATGLDFSLVRVIVTRGSALQPGDSPNVVVFSHPIELSPAMTSLQPVAAPWHTPGWELAGAKTLSYGPNLAARRSARAAGFDDALLISAKDVILEGPTFSVAWVVDGRLETPSLDLAILDSITRQLVLEDAVSSGIEVVEGAWQCDRLDQASEFLVMSTVREVHPVDRVGSLVFELGPIAAELSSTFRQRIGSATSGQASTSAIPVQETRR